MKRSYRFFNILTALIMSGFGLVYAGQKDAFAETTSVKNLSGEVNGVV